MENFKDPLKLLHNLFKQIFTTNSHLDGESITEEEAKTLEELDSFEVIENLKDIVEELLDYKKQNNGSDVNQIVDRCKKFEGIIQRLENEVRNHIRTEYQLKLQLEAAQAKVEKYKLVRNEVASQQSTCEAKNSHQDCEIKINKLLELCENSQKKVSQLESECQKCKQLIQAKQQEIDKLVQEKVLKRQEPRQKNEINFNKKEDFIRQRSRPYGLSPAPTRYKAPTQYRQSMIEMELLRKGDSQYNKLLRQSRVIQKRRQRRASHARSSSEAQRFKR